MYRYLAQACKQPRCFCLYKNNQNKILKIRRANLKICRANCRFQISLLHFWIHSGKGIICWMKIPVSEWVMIWTIICYMVLIFLCVHHIRLWNRHEIWARFLRQKAISIHDPLHITDLRLLCYILNNETILFDLMECLFNNIEFINLIQKIGFE